MEWNLLTIWVFLLLILKGILETDCLERIFGCVFKDCGFCYVLVFGRV